MRPPAARPRIRARGACDRMSCRLPRSSSVKPILPPPPQQPQSRWRCHGGTTPHRRAEAALPQVETHLTWRFRPGDPGDRRPGVPGAALRSVRPIVLEKPLDRPMPRRSRLPGGLRFPPRVGPLGPRGFPDSSSSGPAGLCRFGLLLRHCSVSSSFDPRRCSNHITTF